MAEKVKIEIADAYSADPNRTMEVKGRNLLKGLPEKFVISQEELYPVIHNQAMIIVNSVKEVLESTPPELVGDIYTNGITLTGGGSMLGGFDKLLEHEIGVRAVVADDPRICVAVGAGKSFEYLEKLNQGFSDAVMHNH